MIESIALPDIVPLAHADPADIERLLDAAFGTDRHGRTAYRLRAGVGPIAPLSFAALENGELIGSLQSWPLQLASRDVPLVLVGPVAVLPARQKEGIGRALTAAFCDAADRAGAPPQLLIGDPEYYGRFFGFRAEPTAGWELPGPVERRRLLLRGPADGLPATGTLGPRR